MDKQAEATVYLEKIKFWNMILLIFAGIGTAVGILELPTTLVKSSQIASYQKQLDLTDNPQMVALIKKTMDLAVNPLYRAYGIVMFVLGAALLIGFYTNNKRIKAGGIIKPWPYYGQIVKIVLAMVVSVLTRSITFALSTSIMTVVFNFLWAVPAILTLQHIKHYHRLRKEVKATSRELKTKKK